MTSAAASGLSSLRSVKCRSAARAWAMSTSGTSLAGGSAATWASSSGDGGRLSNVPDRCPRPAPIEARARPGDLPVEQVFHGRASGAAGSAARPPSASSPVMSCRYSGQRSVSSSCVPLSATRPPVQDHDPVGQVQRRPAVRDDQRGAAPHHLAQRGVDLRLQARVDGRGRVVEHQHPGIGDQGPGQGHPLPLPAGQGQALLADHGVVALGQPGDELVGLGRLGRGDDLLVGGVRPAVGDVGPHRVGEQEAVLHDQPDRGAQRVARHVRDVVPADADRAALRIVEPGQQQGQGGLARAGRADHGDRLARLDPEGHAAQHRLATARTRTGRRRS